MSHVDEGLLHAFLDGALPPGDPQHEDIESHLRVCVDCRARLEEARSLRERAGLVLRHGAPAAIAPPPFDQVRERARTVPARPHREPWFPPLELAWAASLILAVGAGWMARELALRGGDLAAPQDDAIELPAQFEDAAGAGSRAAEAETSSRVLSSADSAAAVPATPASLRPNERAQQKAAALEAPPLPEQPGRTTAEAAENVAVRQLRDSIPERRARDERAEIETMERPPSPAARAPQPAAARIDEMAPFPQTLWPEPRFAGLAGMLNDYVAATQSGGWRDATPEDAAAAAGGRLAALDDLPRDSLHITAAGPPLVRSSYRTAEGALVELLQRAASSPDADAFRAAEAPPSDVPLTDIAGQNERFHDQSLLWIRRPGMLLLLKAPLPQDSLAALARRIR